MNMTFIPKCIKFIDGIQRRTASEKLLILPFFPHFSLAFIMNSTLGPAQFTVPNMIIWNKSMVHRIRKQDSLKYQLDKYVHCGNFNYNHLFVFNEQRYWVIPHVYHLCFTFFFTSLSEKRSKSDWVEDHVFEVLAGIILQSIKRFTTKWSHNQLLIVSVHQKGIF